jgi:hypothetical protein
MRWNGRGSTTATPAPCSGRSSGRSQGSTVAIWITGPGGGAWGLVRVDETVWDLSEGEPDRRDAEVALTSDAAWRVLTGGAVADEAIELRGALHLAHPFLSARAIIV